MLSIVVVTAAVEVQPLAPVTVTVYVPAVVTVIAAVVADVDHK
jgi:NADH:ubiquinone oxidoreductase subunit 6 (subunit J)